MPRAVKFGRYGGSDVLEVVDVDQPHPGPGEARRDAYDELAAGHTRGKIVLRVAPD
jgi:hypothetical protein